MENVEVRQYLWVGALCPSYKCAQCDHWRDPTRSFRGVAAAVSRRAFFPAPHVQMDIMAADF